ncbi:Centrosome-associated protein [Dirofilaria immitis]|nr:Centrosome-associated protein [Dirofilaria immitis]
MNKSTSDKASNEGQLISKKDLGKKVIVGRVGAGTLLYVGPVEGKTGIFCGIELDRPEGKHDGTYQGISYFHCSPQHGIFAPLYKVELLQQMHISSRREEKLSRSAIPAIAGRSHSIMSTKVITTTTTTTTTTITQSTTIPSMDISMASISSLGSSSILDHSMIMSGSWNSDTMVNSQATYTIIGSIGQSHYQLLEDIECPSELIEVDDDIPSSYRQLNTSLVLEESRIGVDRLPIVDDNLSTPLVEYTPNNDMQQYQQNQSYMLDNHANHYHAYHQDKTDLPTELSTNLSPIAELTHPNILTSYGIEFPQQLSTALSPADRIPSRMSIDSTISDDITIDGHSLEQQQKLPLPISLPEQEVSPVTSTEAIDCESNFYKSLNHSFTITKVSETETNEQLEDKNKLIIEKSEILKKRRKRKTKKPRPLSIRELQNAPIPIRPLKPKPPSKSQLLMEKLKASIEADKLKPKKILNQNFMKC